MLVIRIERVRVGRIPGTFSYCPESLLTQPVEFLHRIRGISGIDKIGPVTACLEKNLFLKAFHLGTYQFRIDRRRKFGQHRSGSVLDGRYAFDFQGIATAAEIFPEGRDIHPGYFFRRYWCTDPDLDGLPLLVDHLTDKPYGPEHGMDAAENMESPGVPTVEIDGNDRKTCVADNLHYVAGPGLVFDDTTSFLLPCTHFPGREKSQRAASCDMVKCHTDACHTPCSPFGEIIHRDEGVLQIRDLSQKESGQDLEILTTATDDRVQNETVGPSVMMVGNREETTFQGNVLYLLRRDFEGYAELTKDRRGELGAGEIGYILVLAVKMVKFQKPVQKSGYHFTHKPLKAKRLLQAITV